MADITRQISYAMSLRTPQKEALDYLAAISDHCDYQHDSKESVESTATEYCENNNKIKVSEKFNFPSFCYAMATGIGKTRLMGACIYYLYKTKGYRHFFILAPGNTIYEKLRREVRPENSKYIFKGLEAEMGRPKIYDGENYNQYKWEQRGTLVYEKQSEIELFIFNIGKIFNSKTMQFEFHKFNEYLGTSFAEILASFDDLVICMDEAHRYYAPASMQAINYLKPILGLEFTATPKSMSNVIYSYDVARGAVEGYLKTPVVMGRSNMAGYSNEDIEEMKIRDGLTLHERRKNILKQYCYDNNLPYVKPIVLIACKDTNHAKTIRDLIDNDNFQNGKYKGKIIEIHSNMKTEESEENVRLLLSIENSTNPIEIVLHVYKLKEGWDVNNLFTIIPLNAAKSDILAMQTIGRGLRLPFGVATENEDIDTLDIVAHDHYRELVDEIKNDKWFKYKDLDDSTLEPTESIDVSGAADDPDLNLFDMLFTDVGVVSFGQTRTEQTQNDLYNSYLKNFGVPKSKVVDKSREQMSLFDLDTVEDVRDSNPSEDSAVVPAKAEKPLTKEEFVKKITDYSERAISVPKILVQTNSTVKFNSFEVKRNIQDFEIAMAKIERFDVINQQMLAAVDAQSLEVDDAMNSLACLLLDSISELSYDDADFIIDIVEQYLALIDGDEEEKRKIVRRYASLIVTDLKTQIYEHMERKTDEVYLVQKDLIMFRKFVKSIKEDGKVVYNKPFSDKQNIKKYLFTGYKKSYYPENSFDSDTERLFSIILEEDPDVIRWIKPPLNQLGIFWQAGQQYTPDFLVETTGGKFMVEVKALNEVKSEEVVAKAKEGIKWCKFASKSDPDKKTWEYRLISDDQIKIGNTCKYTLGTSHRIKED